MLFVPMAGATRYVSVCYSCHMCIMSSEFARISTPFKIVLLSTCLPTYCHSNCHFASESGLAGSPSFFVHRLLQNRICEDKWHTLLQAGCPSCHLPNSVESLVISFLHPPSDLWWYNHCSLDMSSLAPVPASDASASISVSRIITMPCLHSNVAWWYDGLVIMRSQVRLPMIPLFITTLGKLFTDL